MESQQRIVLFFTLSMAIWLLWNMFFGPKPPPKPAPKNVVEQPADVDDDKKPLAKKDEAGPGRVAAAPGDSDDTDGSDDTEKAANEAPEELAAQKESVLPEYPRKTLHLGSIDADSGYQMFVELTTRGAAIESIQLTDPLYCSLKDRNTPLTVVGNLDTVDPQEWRESRDKRDKLVREVRAIFQRRCVKCHGEKKPRNNLRLDTHQGILLGGDTGPAVLAKDPEGSLLVQAVRREHENLNMPPKEKLTAEEIDKIVRWIDRGVPDLTPVTLQMHVPQIEDRFAQIEESLRSFDWGVDEENSDQSQAIFYIDLPDLRITKTYQLKKTDAQKPETAVDAFYLDFTLAFTNKSPQDRQLNYVLQGPVGVVLEDVINTYKFRDVKIAYLDPENLKVISDIKAAQEIVEGEITQWDEPLLTYVGVDVQYFASFLQPSQEPAGPEDSQIGICTQVLVERDELHPQRSDVSLSLTSTDLQLGHDEADNTVTHTYRLFAGPKREELLQPYAAESMQDFGWFGGVSKIMLSLLAAFYKVIPNYGIAIIMLTVMVRLMLFPMSRKQALGAAKMQELQPEIAALKKKYGKDREKFGRAQMELFRKHRYNPLSGCLVLFVQLPIFIGLYRGLSNSVDLRMAPFLWIENLAAPDALFTLPFELPILATNQFNLLPLLTIVLFVVQQKLFTPPPVDEQQALQQKMMSFMMLFIGFMFYKVPAGLCVYFISTSLWGIGERKLLPKAHKKKTADGDSDRNADEPPARAAKATPKKGAAGKRKSRPRR